MRPAPRHDVTADPDVRLRHVPQRTCVGCRQTRPKATLLRLAATPDGVRFDPEQRLPGRGAYVCPDPRCVAAAARRDGRSLQSALRTRRSDEVVTALDHARQASTPSRPIPDGTHQEEHTA